MNATAVILARRGSKGVPGKNMAPVGGRPCLAWSIEDAMNASLVDRVIVSTDWAAAATLARSMGADVVERPHDLAGDTASVDEAVRHAVPNAEPAPVVILYGNVPVRPADLIDRAISMLTEARADSVQSYAPVGKYHPWWTCIVDEASGAVRPWDGDRLFRSTYRRQDLPPAYIPDGGVLVVDPDALFLRIPGVPDGPHAFLGREDKRRAITSREGQVVDIDSPLDLLVADAILRSERSVGRDARADHHPHVAGVQHT